MMAIDTIKKPARIATAMFFSSRINFRMLCLGVSTSMSTKVTTRMAMPKNEYKMELTSAVDIRLDFLFVKTGTACVPLLLAGESQHAPSRKVGVEH